MFIHIYIYMCFFYFLHLIVWDWCAYICRRMCECVLRVLLPIAISSAHSNIVISFPYFVIIIIYLLFKKTSCCAFFIYRLTRCCCWIFGSAVFLLFFFFFFFLRWLFLRPNTRTIMMAANEFANIFRHFEYSSTLSDRETKKEAKTEEIRVVCKHR